MIAVHALLEPEEAPTKPPSHSSTIGNCLICLPFATTVILGVKPNMDDKGSPKKTLWFGRVWQLQALALQHYRKQVLLKQPSLTWSQKHRIDEVLQDPKKRALLLRMQSVWRGAVTRRTSSLASILQPLEYHMAPFAGAVLFMHGSGGMTGNNVRYARKLASLGYIVLAPDSMAGGEHRHRDLAGCIASHQETPYWGDLGLYTSSTEGEYTYNTDANAVVKDPEKFAKLYDNVFRMRAVEMNWILGRLPEQMKVRGVYTFGQSEGAMTVARFDDRRYGAMIRGRIISAFSVEFNYFTPTRQAAEFGGSTEVATLNLIGDDDQYFGPKQSVAIDVAKKQMGQTITGNAFKQMKLQKLRRGLVAVMEGATHDASETHDNFLRDILRAFMASPHECHTVVEQWKPALYLSSKVKVEEVDNSGDGIRMLIKVGKMDFDAKTPYGEELFKRQMAHCIRQTKSKLESLQGKVVQMTSTPVNASPGRAYGGGISLPCQNYDGGTNLPGQLGSRGTGSPDQTYGGMKLGRSVASTGGATEAWNAHGSSFGIAPSIGPEFTSHFERRFGYGIKFLDDLDRTALRVEWVDGNGPLAAWNSEHPAQALRKNDQIIAVNHVRGSSDAMFDELVNNKSVELIARRSASGGSPRWP